MILREWLREWDRDYLVQSLVSLFKARNSLNRVEFDMTTSLSHYNRRLLKFWGYARPLTKLEGVRDKESGFGKAESLHQSYRWNVRENSAKQPPYPFKLNLFYRNRTDVKCPQSFCISHKDKPSNFESSCLWSTAESTRPLDQIFQITYFSCNQVELYG